MKAKSLGLRVYTASCQKAVNEGHITCNFIFPSMSQIILFFGPLCYLYSNTAILTIHSFVPIHRK